MADQKKYYYIKLKEDFYDSEEMIMLQSMQDGYLYSDILMKLYLRSLKNDGKLMFNNIIPYSPKMIATVTRHQEGTVEKALRIFKQLGLIEVLNNGTIYMLNIQQLIGSSNSEADRMKEYRKRVKAEAQAQLEAQQQELQLQYECNDNRTDECMYERTNERATNVITDEPIIKDRDITRDRERYRDIKELDISKSGNSKSPSLGDLDNPF